MKKSIQLFALITGFAFLAGSAHGAAKWWDINGTTSGSGQSTGIGTWGGVTSTLWNTDSTGGSGGALSTWTLAAGGDSAYFSAGTDATEAFIVTVGANSTVGGVVFEEGTVTVKSQTAGGGNIMSIGTADPVIFVVESDAHGIWQTGSANIGVSVTKKGTGTLTINTENGWGNNTAGKVLTIEEGAIALDNFNWSIGTHHRLGRMPQVTLGGASTTGKLLYTGAAGTWGTHTLYHTAINIAAGGGEISSTTGALTLGIASGTVGILKGTAGGSLTWSGGQSFRLNTVATYDGDTIIAANTELRSGQANVLPFGAGKGDVIVYGLFDTVAGSALCTINGLSGTGTVEGASVLSLGNGDATATFSGFMGNNQRMTIAKKGTGTQTFNGTFGVLDLNDHTTQQTTDITNEAGGLVFTGDANPSSSAYLVLFPSTSVDVSGLNDDYVIGSTNKLIAINTGTRSLTGPTELEAGATVQMAYTAGTPTINVPAGTITLNDNDTTVTVSGGALTAGAYTLISKSGSGAVAGSISGGTLTVNGDGHTGDTATLAITSGQLILTIAAASGPQALHWASGDGTWEIDGSTPWHTSSHTAASYSETTPPGDSALFDDEDSGTSPITVTLDETVQPTSVQFNSSKNWTLTGTGKISGSIGLTKNGSGTVTLATSNDYTGTTAVNAGTLVLGHATDTIAGAITINGGTLDVDNPDTVGTVTLTTGSIIGDSTLTSTATYSLVNGTVSAALAGSVGVSKTAAGTLSLSANNTYTGTTIITAGQVNISHDNALGGTGSGTQVSGASTSLRISGDLTIGEAISINNNASGGQLRSTSGDNEITATVSLGFWSSIGVDAGTLTLSAATAIDKDADNNLYVVGAGNLDVTGVIAGTGSATNFFGTTGTVTLSGNNTYTGATAIQQGTVVINTIANAESSSSLGSPAGDSSAVILMGETGPATLKWTGGATDNTTTRLMRLVGGAGNHATIDASGTGPISFLGSTSMSHVNGDKNLIFTGSNTGDNRFSRDIDLISSGALTVIKDGAGKWILDGDSVFENLNVQNGTLHIGYGGLDGSITASPAVNDSNPTRLVFNRSGTYTFGSGQNITKTGSGGNAVLEQAGPGTLVIAGNLTGGLPWTVSAGTLQIGSGTAGSVGNVNITNSAAVVFNRTDGALNFAGRIEGSGTLGKAGTGTVTLSTENVHTGGTEITGGVLALGNDGALGSGPLTFTGSGGLQSADATARTITNALGNLTGSGVTLTFGATSGGTGALTFTNGYNIATGGSPTRTFQVNSTTTFEAPIAGVGGTILVKQGTGTLVLPAANTFGGATGSLNASNGTVRLTGSVSGDVIVAAAATLDGNGSIGDSLQVIGNLNPGTSIGELTAASATWSEGGTYNWEVSNVSGTPGTDWDHLNVTGNLDVTATTGSKFNINVLATGALGIDYDTPVTWPIATVGGSVSGFSADKFNLNASSVTDDLAGGEFVVQEGSVEVAFSPNPGPVANAAGFPRAKNVALKIPIATLLSGSTTHAKGYARTLSHLQTGAVLNESANGYGITTNTTYIFYTNAVVNTTDTISYVVTDDGAAPYKPGDTRRYSTNTITITVVDSIGAITVEQVGGGQIDLKFYGIPGYDYVVQRSCGDLESWADLSGVLTAPDSGPNIGLIEYTDTPGGGCNPAYYRIRSN